MMSHAANWRRVRLRRYGIGLLLVVSALALPPTGSAADAPALYPPKEYGALDYYQFRERDFAGRNPQFDPPDYYRSYGDKYILRFTFQTEPLLSSRGQQWSKDTRILLQVLMEEAILADPAGFALLERDAETFRQFAFSTHAEAYWEAGIADLPIRDLILIFLTPDVEDLISEGGRQQTQEVASCLRAEWGERASEDPGFIRLKAQELFAALNDRTVMRIVLSRFAQLLRYIDRQRYSRRVARQAVDDFFAPFDLFFEMWR